LIFWRRRWRFALERRHPASKGDAWLLFHIWLQRFAIGRCFRGAVQDGEARD
jgi:hypothetical protein